MATATLFSISLTEEERTDLLRLVDEAAREMHVEARRTENPTYQSSIHEQEARLRNLAQKLRQANV
jgi:hypothetical protein